MCADDVGIVLCNIHELVAVYTIFFKAQLAAGLHLKHSKCNLVPLSAPLTPDLRNTINIFLRDEVPEWLAFCIVDTAEYLGIWIGPGAGSRNWTAQCAGFLGVTNLIQQAGCPTALAVSTYNLKAISKLSYPAQFLASPP